MEGFHIFLFAGYPLGICYSLLLKIAIGIVDLAIKNADLPGPPLGGSSHLVSGL